MAAERSAARRVYLDWARGLAVLLMILWHTLDAWTRVPDRGSAMFGRALILGGFAAPLFLWLAGLGAALYASRLTELDASRRPAVTAVVRRGLEIFILAFLFRLQAFIVSPGAHLITIFRVDILNVMGPALVATGLLWAIGSRNSKPIALLVVYSLAAAITALLTPLIRSSALVDLLPHGLQWYVRPAGDLTTFTLLPWAGFVFAGAACGVLLARADQAAAERRMVAGFAAAGISLVALAQYLAAQPSIYRQSYFWTTSPTWFAMRVGILMIAVAAVFGVARAAARWGFRAPALARLGQRSLFVYWIHVELVYGYATWPLHGKLPLWGSLVACALFCALMHGAAVIHERLAGKWRSRRREHSTPQAAMA